MKRSCCSFAMVAAAVMVSGAGRVAAQAPGQVAAPAPAVTPAFLEKRVPEELASEGTLLSRRELSLKIERVGALWLVSLVDANTGRIAATTKLYELSADRDAAVATMTHVVAELAELAAEIASRKQPAPEAVAAPVTASDLADLAVRENTARDEREKAELSFRRHAIHFGKQLVVHGSTATVSEGWDIYQGELDQPMSAAAFYTAVKRPDLLARYNARMRLGKTIFVLGALSSVTGVGLMLFDHHRDNPTGTPQGLTVGLPFAIIGVAVSTAGLFVGGAAHPISEGEAKSLADDYNQHLRQQLGLPVVSQRERAPAIRDLAIAPYATGTGGGLAFGGKF